MMRAKTPTIDRLIEAGSFTPIARTVMPSVTLPAHTSMHRGVDVPRHGVTTNTFHPLARPVPRIFDVAAKYDKRTAFFANWPELRDLCDAGSVDYGYLMRSSDGPEHDDEIAEAAVAHIERVDLDLVFVYLGHTDTAGHAHAWMSDPYLAAIENADICIGRVLDAVAKTGRSVVTLVQSDHGGHEKTHGTEMDEDMLIPWILSGPGIRSGHRIESKVRIFDTCPTLAALLGLPQAKEWEGVPIQEAVAR